MTSPRMARASRWCTKADRRATTLVVGLVLGACTSPPAPTFDAQAETANWVELWRTYDLKSIDDLFVADSTVSYLSSEREGLILGIDSLRAHHEGFGFVSGGTAPASELWLEGIHGQQWGDVATVTAVWFFGDRSTPDGVQRGPVTFVYVWRDGTWKIGHAQFANYE